MNWYDSAENKTARPTTTTTTDSNSQEQQPTMMAPTTTGRKNKKESNKANFQEPKITWKKSDAKWLLYKDVMDGLVPLEATNHDNGQSTMQLREIYIMRPEYSHYLYAIFSSRLSSLRKTIKVANIRAKDGEEAFKNYKQNHGLSEFSHRGYIQWKGSEAQELLEEDMEAGLHKRLEKKELWGSRPEYYESFPLTAFRDKIHQEI
jgi:hypothetical protein